MHMNLQFYNTLRRNKEQFVPIDPTCIRFYVCGPTVYNYIHIGNARPAVIFDVLFRVLQQLYPQVKYVRNITDVDDKIHRPPKLPTPPSVPSHSNLPRPIIKICMRWATYHLRLNRVRLNIYRQ
jgi:lysyl-tRNA synthetase class I